MFWIVCFVNNQSNAFFLANREIDRGACKDAQHASNLNTTVIFHNKCIINGWGLPYNAIKLHKYYWRISNWYNYLF